MNTPSKWPFVTNGLIFGMSAGDSIPAKDVGSDGPFPLFGSNGIRGYVTKTNQEEPTLLVGRQGSVGTVHATNGPCWVSEHALRVCPRMPVEIRWLAYSLISARLADLSHGTAQPGISAGAVLREKIPLPDLPTQRRIADYLDRETAQIDAMAGALDGLVARLEERRVAAIENATHALSESSDGIPHEWVFIPFKWAVEDHFPGDWGGDPGSNDTDRLCVRVADFDRTSGTVGGDVPTLRSYTTRSVNERHLRTHDLLLEKSGGTPKNPVGRVVLYTGSPGRMTTNFVQCIRLNADHESRFWHYVFLAAYKTRFTNVHVRQTTGIQNLGIGGFFDEKFACPPLDEQRRIADHLDAETAKIDAMIAKAGELRALLDERRSALITATVTGQHPVPKEP